MNTTNRIYLNNQQTIDFTFKQNRHDFIVNEIPLQPFSKDKGKYLILHIKKEFTSTWDLLNRIEEVLDIRSSEIGYAGLKDKNATTTQYISLPMRFSKDIEQIQTKHIKIIGKYKHYEKLKIGDLKGNAFTINLLDVKAEDLPTIYQSLSKIQKHGMPNYFGFQRFGTDGNFDYAKAVVYGDEIINDHKLKRMMISAYQSYFFNAWLAHRVDISREKGLNRLELLEGDIAFEYSSGKSFAAQNTPSIQNNYKQKLLCPAGLLPGRKVNRATRDARQIEEQYDDEYIHDKGYRRASWIYPQNIKNKYNEKEKVLQLQFELPKGAYATVLIENLANKIIKTA
ncbi:MAG: tRNA pseudouridine(13) synthase TruD [Campylobacterota bacterium]|nr:tRNA pseudouridine(13) synthase TruD [Campylobacterota bacterium]